MIEPLEIHMLGDFQIRQGSRVISGDAWKLRKAARIVKLSPETALRDAERTLSFDAATPISTIDRE